MIKLAIDAMGGDFAPKEIVKGCNLAIAKNTDLELVLYGDEEQIKKYLISNPRISVVHSPKKIDMGEDDPIREIRRNRDTSLVMAFQAVKDKQVDGVVTAGPTQGVIVAAHLIIRRIKGMKRVALAPALPVIGGKSRLLLDVGANLELRSEHILQIAQFASIYLQETHNIKTPIVGLVNIGAEPSKGREVDQETYQILKNDPHFNFYGNVEPKELFSCPCDILVTDGFTGNMVMKTMEGTAKALGDVLKEEISSSVGGKIGYLFMRKNLRNFKNRFNPDNIGGANLFGVDGVVVKAHGSSEAFAFYNAINQAYQSVRGEIVEKMKKIISDVIVDE